MKFIVFVVVGILIAVVGGQLLLGDLTLAKGTAISMFTAYGAYGYAVLKEYTT